MATAQCHARPSGNPRSFTAAKLTPNECVVDSARCLICSVGICVHNNNNNSKSNGVDSNNSRRIGDRHLQNGRPGVSGKLQAKVEVGINGSTQEGTGVELTGMPQGGTEGVRQSVKRVASRVERSPSPEPRLKRGRQCEVPPGAPPSAQLKAVRKKPVTAPVDVVSDQIRKIFSTCRQSEDTYRKKLMLLERVRRLLAGSFQWFELHVVGSTCTGFACDSSDMDVCLYLSDVWIDQATRAKRILSRVRSLILQEFDFRVVLIHAKVPILRCTYVSTGIQMDLNCNNIVGIRNTHLLRSYSQIDDRVSPLIVVVKLWAQSHDINDASRCTLSSYSLALMVIHFLQYGVQPAVLPNLQRLFQQKFSPAQPVSAIPKHDRQQSYRSSNPASLGDLFSSFLRYYSEEFDFSVHVASVRTGTRLYKYQCATAQHESGLDPHQRGWKYICVEEPFTRLNTARAVHDLVQFHRIVHVFLRSYSLLRMSKHLRCVFGSQVDNDILRLI